MTGLRSILTIAAAVILTAAAGCVRISEKGQTQTVVSLQKIQQSAREKHLEVNAFSTVQQRAGEFRNREKRVHLDELLREKNNAVSPEIIAGHLEDAIGSNHLLGGVEPGSDLVKIQSRRSGQLLDFAVASAAVRLGAALQLCELDGYGNRQEIQQYEMELRNLSGVSPQELARLDLSKLPKPFRLKTKLIALQQFAAFNRPESAGTVIYPELLEDIRTLFKNESRLSLLYAVNLYDFHTALSGRKVESDSLHRKTVRLANAVGAALQVEEDVKKLNTVYDACRLEELKLQLNKNVTPELRANVIRLTAQWHLAWLKLRTDLGMTDFDLPLPAFPEQNPPELTGETALFFEIIGKK